MDWHAFAAFGVIFCVFHLRVAQSFPGVEAKTRERRSPQSNGILVQANLDGGLNIQQVASTVRKRLHDLVDTVTNPLIQNAMAVNSPDAYYEQYDYDYQQNRNPPPGSRFEHGRHRGGPPYRHHPIGPRGHHPRGPPPHGPPHRHHGPPPRFHGPPPRGPPPRFPPNIPFPENSNEEDTQTRPNFSQQPNYPVGGGSSSKTTPTDMDATSQTSEEASNVAGYIEDNFPVILLNENEIRRR